MLDTLLEKYLEISVRSVNIFSIVPNKEYSYIFSDVNDSL